MQHCPACNQSFPDGGPAFCPTDRIPLTSDDPAGIPLPNSQEQVIIGPLQGKREHTLASTPSGKFIKFLLNITIIGRFINADTMGTKYLLTVEGRDYPVSMETYYKFRPGQPVEIHVEPHSGKVLGVYPAKGEASGEVRPENNITTAQSAFAPAQPYTPASVPSDAQAPVARPRNWGKTILIGILAISVISVGAYFYFRDPRPPGEVFPEQLGRFRKSTASVLYDKYSSVGNGKYFRTFYNVEGTGDNGVLYGVWDYPSADEALRLFPSAQRYLTRGDAKIIQKDETRIVTYGPVTSRSSNMEAVVFWVDGARIMQVAGNNQQIVYEFEGALRNRPPAEVIRVEPSGGPATSKADPSAIPVIALLDEIQKSEKAADKKYKGQTITVAGEVTKVGKDDKGNPIILLTRPGDKSVVPAFIGCPVKSSKASSAIKGGQAVRVKGRYVFSLNGSASLVDCELL